jgi:hypothetical protein
MARTPDNIPVIKVAAPGVAHGSFDHDPTSRLELVAEARRDVLEVIPGQVPSQA